MALQGQYARNKQRRNRNVNADVDESLFGNRKTKSGGGRSGRGSRAGSGGAAVVSSSYLNATREGVTGPGPKNSIVVSSGELYNMQNQSVILTAEELRRRKQAEQNKKEGVRKKAQARKDRMVQLEEEKRKKAPIMTESEEIALKANTTILINANDAKDAELDDVKHMNQMMLYAKCATIRDMQLREKAQSMENKRKEEMRLDSEMEVKRIRDIKMLEDRDRVRKEEQRIGAQCIIQQIQEREQERVRIQEIKDQEAQAMLKRIKLAEEKQEQERLAKIEAGKRLMEEVYKANDAQARAKLLAKQREIDEDQRIAEYIREKEAREAANEAELARIKHEKDQEIARMRARQEKANDQRGAMDELRARRYQEAHERQWREKQLALQQKRDAQMKDIIVAREFQRKEKARLMADQAAQDREEHERILEWNREQAMLEETKEKAMGEKQSVHREELLQQIFVKEQEKAQARQRFLTEGKDISRQLAADKRKLNMIKQAKLKQLHDAGVPDKYLTELSKKKCMVATFR